MGIDPTLIHPVTVIIEQGDKADTSYRNDAREPVRKLKRKANVTLSGQIKWKKTDDPSPDFTGITEDSLGYILLKWKDLDKLGVVVARGDKIIKIDRIDYELYVTQLMPSGHYPDQNGSTLLKAFFADREPT